eukprot:3130201-Amphidinium_carterae.1
MSCHEFSKTNVMHSIMVEKNFVWAGITVMMIQSVSRHRDVRYSVGLVGCFVTAYNCDGNDYNCNSKKYVIVMFN